MKRKFLAACEKQRGMKWPLISTLQVLRTRRHLSAVRAVIGAYALGHVWLNHGWYNPLLNIILSSSLTFWVDSFTASRMKILDTWNYFFLKKCGVPPMKTKASIDVTRQSTAITKFMLP